MSSADEPDFGFLSDGGSDSESSDQFSFQEPEPPACELPAVEETTADAPKPKQVKRVPAKAKPQTESPAALPNDSDVSATSTKKRVRRVRPNATAAEPEAEFRAPDTLDTVPKSRFLSLAAFAALVTLILLLQLLGVIHLGTAHQLESLPDVAPLKSGEFQTIPETASLPAGHELRLGQEARFGDVIFTPTKVVREPLSFVHMTTGKEAEDLQASDVIKLHFTIQNASSSIAFPPWDVSLMTHRSPMEGIDESTKANSWLMIEGSDGSRRILNYLHSPQSSFNIVGMESRSLLKPDEIRSTFIVSSEGAGDWRQADSKLRWRIQLRKGIDQQSKNSVTTLVDVTFTDDEISAGPAT